MTANPNFVMETAAALHLVACTRGFRVLDPQTNWSPLPAKRVCHNMLLVYRVTHGFAERLRELAAAVPGAAPAHSLQQGERVGGVTCALLAVPSIPLAPCSRNMQGCLQTPPTRADQQVGGRARRLPGKGRMRRSPEHDSKAFAAWCAAPVSRFMASDIGASLRGFIWRKLRKST